MRPPPVRARVRRRRRRATTRRRDERRSSPPTPIRARRRLHPRVHRAQQSLARLLVALSRHDVRSRVRSRVVVERALVGVHAPAAFFTATATPRARRVRLARVATTKKRLGRVAPSPRVDSRDVERGALASNRDRSSTIFFSCCAGPSVCLFGQTVKRCIVCMMLPYVYLNGVVSETSRQNEK